MSASTDLVIRPVSPDQHDAVLRYFDLVAYADNPAWSDCYCIAPIRADHNARTRDQNRAERSELVRTAKANGLVAYRLGRVVGWCHAAPKSELVGLPPGGETDVGAVVCFVVAPDARRQGIATALLAAAIDHLRERGLAAVEGYPLNDEPPTVAAKALYVGPKAMYLKAGFEPVKEGPGYTVVRRAL